MDLVKSRQRVIDHGEVFTPAWIVDAMLDLVRDESERIDSRFLETACGSGNFLVTVLHRKLVTVRAKYRGSEFEARHHGLLGLMCVYGVELLKDNVFDCRSNLLNVFTEHLKVEVDDKWHRAARAVLDANIVQGDALTMTKADSEPITFAEWGYLGKGKFQRRDFRFDALTESAAFSAEGNLFAELDKHEIFTPVKTYPAMTVGDLAA